MKRQNSAEATVEGILIKQIMNGIYKANTYLLPERKLAELLNYSRPVIHKAIIRLESKGLVTIIPRQGILVNDFREKGKLSLLEGIYDLYREGIDEHLQKSMLDFIKSNLLSILKLNMSLPLTNRMQVYTPIEITKGVHVYEWLLKHALNCGNPLYAMLINEFKVGILNVSTVMMTSRSALPFSQIPSDIDHLLLQTEVDELCIIDKVNKFFDFIEIVWLKGEVKSE